MTEAEEYIEWRIKFESDYGTWLRPQEAWIDAKASSRKQIEELQARIAMQDEALNEYLRAGVGNSTDLCVQAHARMLADKARAAISRTPADTPDTAPQPPEV